MSGVTIKGADELQAGLKRASVEMRDLPGVHPKVAALITRTVNPPKRTGRLAASIRPDVGQGQAIVHADAPYAAIVEHGSTARNITGRHYMRDGMIRAQPGILKLYTDELQAILDRAV